MFKVSKLLKSIPHQIHRNAMLCQLVAYISCRELIVFFVKVKKEKIIQWNWSTELQLHNLVWKPKEVYINLPHIFMKFDNEVKNALFDSFWINFDFLQGPLAKWKGKIFKLMFAKNLFKDNKNAKLAVNILTMQFLFIVSGIRFLKEKYVRIFPHMKYICSI